MELTRDRLLPRAGSQGKADAASTIGRTAMMFTLAAALTACSPSTQPDEAAEITEPVRVIDAAQVIDLATGEVRADHRLVVRAGHIVAVGPANEIAIPPGASIIDGRGAFVMPGLWDMHVHLEAVGFEAAFPALLAHGVVGVRDMGGSAERLIPLRERVANGAVIGPRVVTAGRMLDGETDGWPYRITVTRPEEGTRAVAEQAARGVDFIKVHGRLDRASYLAIMEAAETHGLPVAGHVPSAVETALAIDRDQRSLEHMISVPSCSAAGPAPDPEAEGRCTHPALEPLRAALRGKDIWHTPTLVVHRNSMLQDDPSFTSTFASVPLLEVTRDFWDLQVEANGTLPPLPLRQAYFAGIKAMTATFADDGFPLLAGSDLGFLYTLPGVSLHDELRLMVEAGLTPLDAIRTATVEPARFLGNAGTNGTIAPGQRADLVFFARDPLADIDHLRSIRAVMLGGSYLDRPALDALKVATTEAPRQADRPAVGPRRPIAPESTRSR